MFETLIPILLMTAAEPPVAAPGGGSAPAGSPADPSRPAIPRPEPLPAAIPPAVAFPHPMISEVLFAVPTTGDNDANRSGKREVSGDEFIEIVNPHDRSIELKGYTLTDGSPTAKTTLKFVFPAITLPPRGVVVVFNGHDSRIPGPVGDAKAAPIGVNDNFHKGVVFTARVGSSRVSFSNAGDAACLKSPTGIPIQRVRWGKADEKSGGTAFALDEIAPAGSKGSVQRDGIGKDGAWKSHLEVDSTPFSPGAFAPLDAKVESAPLKTSPAHEAPPATR